MFKKFICSCESHHPFKVYWNAMGVRVKHFSPSMTLKESLGYGPQICDGTYGKFVTYTLKPTGDQFLDKLYLRYLATRMPTWVQCPASKLKDIVPQVEIYLDDDPDQQVFGHPHLFIDGMKCTSGLPFSSPDVRFFSREKVFLTPESDAMVQSWVDSLSWGNFDREEPCVLWFKYQVWIIASYKYCSTEELRIFLETEGQKYYNAYYSKMDLYQKTLEKKDFQP